MYNFRAESKLMVFFLYYAFAVTLSLIFFTIGSRNTALYTQGFTDYFSCEAFGVDPDDPCVFEVDRRGDQILTFISIGMYSIGAYVALICIAPVDKIKEKSKMWLRSSANIPQDGAKTFPVDTQI